MIKILSLSLATFLGFAAFGQRSDDKSVTDYFKKNTDKINLSEATANDVFIDRIVKDEPSGLTHFYVNQLVNGLPVINGTAVLVKKGDLMLMSGNRFIPGQAEVVAKTEAIKPSFVLTNIWTELSGEVYYSSPQAIDLGNNKFSISDNHISENEIPMELAYFYDGTKFCLVYETSIKVPKADHWWNVYADATSGEVLKKIDWIVTCLFEGCASENHFDHTNLTQPEMGHQLMMAPAPPPQNDSYNVFALPVESPSHGNRSVVVGSFDVTASPYGWHDNNGIPGAEYTVTRGNNVRATEDIDDNNIPGPSPDGGAGLIFDYPYTAGDPGSYVDAAITNLFYMNNKMHDIWYHYGFTEEAGNFQDNNYGNGGFDDDYVNADAQDGSGTNNANFGTPPDGSNPRMQMFIWNSSATAELLEINSPSTFAGMYTSTLASFAPQPPAIPITEDLVLANSGGSEPLDACNTIINIGEMNGKIAVVRRGSCTFATKVENCQAAGALAVIVVNNVNGNPITMGGFSSIANIPAIMVSQNNGNTFITAIQNGSTLNGSIADAANLNSKDSDLDNVIIAHEYGHGISNRLTGGGNNTDCLYNEDQMGEGWSDWLGLMMTIEPGDLSTDIRGVGTYVTNASTTGTGIRPAPYSTDFSINNYTYGATNNSTISQPHGIGFVWATMLWDLTWAFIAQDGFDPDLINGTGGNNVAMTLVMEGMKLQPCGPGMVDGRDAILMADQLLNNGANECLIWNVFAKRGLGFNAQQGNEDDRFDQIENFNVPQVCLFGLEENDFGAQVNVYPNPTEGHVTVAISDNTNISDIQILDINGREVHRFTNVNSDKISFDINEFQLGVYFVKVSSENGTQTRKIIKE